MNNPSLYLEVKNEIEFANLLRKGGFDVAPMNDPPWATEAATWQGFLCHKEGAVVGASITILHSGQNKPFVCVHPCRTLLWLFYRPRDLRLVHNVVNHLLANGGCILPPCNNDSDIEHPR